MDLYRIIRELVHERDRLQRIIDSLEEMTSLGKVAVRPPGKRRGRKSMDSKARAEVSERMKRYWKQRRAEKEATPRAGSRKDSDELG
ncbi:MAG: hypothetical protein M3N93_02325 [Acidobacteriota bacterium]|nr:hypothetical protein [Acidobacteriota bacterium]